MKVQCSCAAQAKPSPATQAAAAVQAVSLGPGDAPATGPADKPDTLIGKWQLVSGIRRMPSDSVFLQHCTPCLHSSLVGSLSCRPGRCAGGVDGAGLGDAARAGAD